jgi:glycosyltransferase involved in cell wall biosynthesis
MNPISVVIIAKNAQETIVECLESLCRFDEVVLYLNNTTDKTVELASTFSNVKIIEGEFIGFGPTKNKAAQYAKTAAADGLTGEVAAMSDYERILKY